MELEKDDSLIELLDGEESSGLYEVRLKDFDGPFDTLCHLIRKSKYSIEDVKISDITEQYMEYMSQLDELDMEKATEFITMAAWLLEIKSRTLLPKPPAEPEAEDDPEQTLRQQLAEYSLIKEASQKMKESENINMLFRAPDESVGQPRFVLKSMDTSGLMNALSKIFLKLEQRATEIRERHIVKDNFTVEEKIAYIKDRLISSESVSFFDLFDPNSFSKNEVITTFQSLLELLKLQYITCEQQEIYGDIIITRSSAYESLLDGGQESLELEAVQSELTTGQDELT